MIFNPIRIIISKKYLGVKLNFSFCLGMGLFVSTEGGWGGEGGRRQLQIMDMELLQVEVLEGI
jgi:hypothetical protein